MEVDLCSTHHLNCLKLQGRQVDIDSLRNYKSQLISAGRQLLNIDTAHHHQFHRLRQYLKRCKRKNGYV